MIAIGGTNIVKAYLGSTELKNIAIGDELLLSSGPEDQDFDKEGFLEKTRIASKGVAAGNNSYITTRFFGVIPGHRLKVKTTRKATNDIVAWYSEDNQSSWLSQNANFVQPTTFTVQEGCYYTRFCTLTANIDDAYILDVTSNKWIWKGDNVTQPD